MTNVISVRFRGGCKTYYFDPRELTVQDGDDVIVETNQGLEFVHCTQGNHPVADSMVVQPLRPVLRLATENDRRTAQLCRQKEKDAFRICQKKIAEHKLEMKLVRVECNFDSSKILFFFTADGRVDFRELVKDLASVFRARIELRQIGVRDEARRSRHLRPSVLLQPVHGGLRPRIHQDGQDAESFAQPHEDLRHLRAADVLPEV